jgi:hypothetical protein
MYFPYSALGAWGSNVGVWSPARVTAISPQKLSGTTVVVPISGGISGIFPDEAEHSALPQTINQVAADIFVALQQGKPGNRVCKGYGHRRRAAFFRGFIVESKNECLIQECS